MVFNYAAPLERDKYSEIRAYVPYNKPFSPFLSPLAFLIYKIGFL